MSECGGTEWQGKSEVLPGGGTFLAECYISSKVGAESEAAGVWTLYHTYTTPALKGGDYTIQGNLEVITELAEADVRMTVIFSDGKPSITAEDTKPVLAGSSEQTSSLLRSQLGVDPGSTITVNLEFRTGGDPNPVAAELAEIEIQKCEPGGDEVTARSFLLFGASGIASSTTVRYLYPSFVSQLAQTVPVQVQTPTGVAFKAFRMTVLHNNPDGNGRDVVYTLRKNGVATALAVTMASTDATGETVATVDFGATERFDIEVTKPDGSIGNSPDDIVVLLEVGT